MGTCTVTSGETEPARNEKQLRIGRASNGALTGGHRVKPVLRIVRLAVSAAGDQPVDKRRRTASCPGKTFTPRAVRGLDVYGEIANFGAGIFGQALREKAPRVGEPKPAQRLLDDVRRQEPEPNRHGFTYALNRGWFAVLEHSRVPTARSEYAPRRAAANRS